MEKVPSFRPNPDLKLMDQVREVLRYYHYAYRTEQTYCDWISKSLPRFNHLPSYSCTTPLLTKQKAAVSA